LCAVIAWVGRGWLHELASLAIIVLQLGLVKVARIRAGVRGRPVNAKNLEYHDGQDASPVPLGHLCLERDVTLVLALRTVLPVKDSLPPVGVGLRARACLLTFNLLSGVHVLLGESQTANSCPLEVGLGHGAANGMPLEGPLWHELKLHEQFRRRLLVARRILLIRAVRLNELVQRDELRHFEGTISLECSKETIEHRQNGHQ